MQQPCRLCIVWEKSSVPVGFRQHAQQDPRKITAVNPVEFPSCMPEIPTDVWVHDPTRAKLSTGRQPTDSKLLSFDLMQMGIAYKRQRWVAESEPSS